MSNVLDGDGFRAASRYDPMLYVCRRWTEIAISIPQFWSRIDVYDGKKDSFEENSEVLKLRLFRASNSSLHITWHRAYHPKEILALLSTRVKSWVSLEMTDDTYGHVESLLSVASQASLLETIRIADRWEFSSTGEELPIMDWPKLRVIDFDWQGYGIVIKRIRAPLLETLSRVFPSHHSEWQFIEKQFPNITELNLYRHGPETRIVDALALPCSFSSVTHLTLDAAVISLSRNLHLPRLQHLTLCDLGRFTTPEDYGIVPESIATSVTELVFIHVLDHNEDSHGQILTLLPRFSNINELSLVYFSNVERILAPLSPVDGQTLCPKLRAVALKGCSVNWKGLITFARSRSTDDSPNGIPFCGLDIEGCSSPKSYHSWPVVYDADLKAIRKLKPKTREIAEESGSDTF